MGTGRVRLALVLIIALWLVDACAGAPSRTKSATENPLAQGSAQATYQGTPVGFTDEGYPYRGDPDAPVTLTEYSDYLCPFCARHFGQTVPTLIERYVQTGQVQYVFRDMPLVSLHPTAPKDPATGFGWHR